jgi:ApbE superfamily uncharacterized protein (UPF0280 family)
MANLIYDSGREAFLNGDIDFTNDDIRVILLSSGYTFSSAHDFLNDVAGGGVRVATSSALTGKSSTAGVADAADVTFTAVSGSQVTQFIIYQHTGTESTSRLIAYFDTATNLPITPNGGDITIQWDNGANKIFKL